MKCFYDADDKNVMLRSAQSRSKSRLQELISFAKISGFKKLGIANCKSVQKYADKLAELLRDAGFDVYAVNCRESGLCGNEICDAMTGACCDPVFQAKYLNEQKTDFNIAIGLCLGHGLLFQKYSEAEVTTFLVKDFAHNHNMAAALSEE